MTSDALLVVQSLFTSIWSLFVSFHIPGTRTTPAEFAFLVLTLAVLIRFLRRIFGQTSEGDD